jgi:hypothetical protein
LVDANGSRLSESVAVHTDATLGLGKCQQAAVVFYERSFDSSLVLRPLAWDSRLDRLGVYIVPAQSSPQQTIWHLIEAKWENEQESGENHHIYVEILDASGQRVVGQPVTIFWQGGSITGVTQDIPGAEYSFSYPMYKAGNSYNIKRESLWPSDALIGAGLRHT